MALSRSILFSSMLLHVLAIEHGLADEAIRRATVQQSILDRMWVRALVPNGDNSSHQLHVLLNATTAALVTNDASMVAGLLVYAGDSALIGHASVDQGWDNKLSRALLTATDKEHASTTSSLSELGELADHLGFVLLAVLNQRGQPYDDLVRLALQGGSEESDSLCYALACASAEKPAMPLQRLALSSSGTLRARAVDLLLSEEPENGVNGLLAAWVRIGRRDEAGALEALHTSIRKELWAIHPNRHPEGVSAQSMVIPSSDFGQRSGLTGERWQRRYGQVFIRKDSVVLRRGLQEVLKCRDMCNVLRASQPRRGDATALSALLYCAGLRLMSDQSALSSQVLIGKHLCKSFRSEAEAFCDDHSIEYHEIVDSETAFISREKDLGQFKRIIALSGAHVALNGEFPFSVERVFLRQRGLDVGMTEKAVAAFCRRVAAAVGDR